VAVYRSPVISDAFSVTLDKILNNLHVERIIIAGDCNEDILGNNILTKTGLLES